MTHWGHGTAKVPREAMSLNHKDMGAKLSLESGFNNGVLIIYHEMMVVKERKHLSCAVKHSTIQSRNATQRLAKLCTLWK